MLLFLQQVMKDKWINAGYEGDDLKPHIEPVEDYSDPARIGESAWSALPQLAVGWSLFIVFLFVFLRGDGRDGFHSRGNQGLSAQSKVQ